MKANTFESGSNNTEISTSNSASPDAIYEAPTTTAATVQFSDAQAQKGSLSLRFVYSNVSGAAGVRFNQTGASNSAVRFYIRTASRPSTAAMGVFTLTPTTTTNRYISFMIDNNGRPLIFDYAGGWWGYGGATSTTGSGAYSLDTWYRIEVGVTNPSTTTGQATLKSYLGDDTSEIANLSFTTTADRNYGGAAIANLYLGRFNAATPTANGTPTWYYDDVAWEVGSATLLGPSASGGVTLTPSSVDGAATIPSLTSVRNALISIGGMSKQGVW